jgi:hypothetical protein
MYEIGTKPEDRMTVGELIEKLGEMPRDAEVTIWGWREDYWTPVGLRAVEMTDFAGAPGWEWVPGDSRGHRTYVELQRKPKS